MGILYISKLLEFAAADDVARFIHEVEVKGCDVDESSLWYGRSFGLNKMGFEERTPVMIASLLGSIEVLKYVIGTGKIDVNRACGSDRATALHCAAAGGSWSSVEVVELLIAAGGNIGIVDANGKKPGDLIAPCINFSSNLNRKMLEMLLNGIVVEEEARTPRASEKKEYPIDISMPDINFGLYGTDEFRMYCFKVQPCSRAYSHDWTECPFVHPGENARRRDPKKYHYTCVPCPDFKKGSCVKGDSCEYAHGVFESWLHPAQYRTRLCKDEMDCARKVCFFAHKREELRPLYASTGSGIPSPKSSSINSLDATTLSPMSLSSPSFTMTNTSTPPMSPSVTCSSPMSGGSMWQNKVNFTPPALQLSGSRLKTALSARDAKLDMELFGLEKIETQQQQRQQLADELVSLSSPYRRNGDSTPTNLHDYFGSLDLSHLQGLSPTVQSPIRQNTTQLRASYPSSIPSAPFRKPSAYGRDSSAAVAAAVMNSRSAAFAKRSQSFIDRSGGNYRSGFPGSTNSPSLMQTNIPEWGSHNGGIDWGYNGEEVNNKFRKSVSFALRDDNLSMSQLGLNEPDVSWVNSLVKDAPSGGVGLYSSEQRRRGVRGVVMPNWVDQMYLEQEQIVA